jgi:transposase InsO family protein
MRRRMAREAKFVSSYLQNSKFTKWAPDTIIKLKRFMSRPAGCAFLGSSASTTKVWLGEYGKNPSEITADSGSDITLISQKALSEMERPPKVRTGQRVNLIQVTGVSKISGFVTLPVFFDTNEGPVQVDIEAYVVKGMTTPLILGNDFADQYSISLLRDGSDSYLTFGDTGRRTQIVNSVGSSFITEEGHTFKIRTMPDMVSLTSKFKAHRKQKRYRKQAHQRVKDSFVRACEHHVIPPQSSVRVPVQVNFPKNSESVYVEKILASNRGPEDFYGSPDVILTRSNPSLPISNFSSNPITIFPGQKLGISHNSLTWLDHHSSADEQSNSYQLRHASLIKSIAQQISSPSTKITLSEDSLPADDSLAGGPKTQEVPPEDIPSSQLLSEVDFSPDLNPSQHSQLEKVVKKYQNAFGLDGRLGNYNAKVEIKLRPDATEVSLPPYNASPAKREVIDAQIDAWLKLEVIEPSKSPWGFPVLIVYRNGKPRMCIDYRKLNEHAIPDEFPLPRQDTILQALTGSQWLSTLDALAGFTQLSMDDDAKEKTAFRTHRGLYQFRRMPFGYRNGPSVFQRVMQNVLSPYLWIFTLVYIDDIVIYSKTFEEHLQHLGKVFDSIERSGLTLSPAKCHLAYQSLMLLGQKVSRLGLSTHKEKVDAIVSLSPPKNVHELQMFLGMMVYFSAYIPFYAWIVAPLFELLKKDVDWKWTDIQQEAFDLAKLALTNSPVRAYAIPGNGYRVYSDACDVGIAAILQQVQPLQIQDLKGTKLYAKLRSAFDQNQPVPPTVATLSKDELIPPPGPWSSDFDSTIIHVERVIAYWSRTLKPAERNYSPTEREALALRDGLIKFQPYIEGEKITAITDHAALIWSRTFQNVNRRLLTWGTVFAAYPDLKIVHRAGKVHSNVDPISRLRRDVPIQHGPVQDSSAHVSIIEDPDSIEDLYSSIHSQFDSRTKTLASATRDQQDLLPNSTINIQIPIPNNSSDSTINYCTSRSYNLIAELDKSEIQNFAIGYKNDPYFNKIIQDIRAESDWSSPLHPLFSENDNGLLYFEDWEGRMRLCVPECERSKIMSEMHDELTEGAHAGYHRTYNKLSSIYYWPKMSRDIKRFVISCDICQKSKPKRHAPVGLLQPIPIPERPFEVVTMDFIPELPVSNGFDNILVIVDKLTKFAIFIPTTSNINESETASLFFKYVVSRFGLPRQIITDRDSKWTSNFWKVICEKSGMRRSMTTAHHPQADGQTEIMNQILEIALRCYVNPSKNDWSNMLDSFALSYNNIPHTATQFTPSFLLYGFHPITASSLLHTSSELVNRPDNNFYGAKNSTSHTPLDQQENEGALQFLDEFNSFRNKAKESIYFAQVTQQRIYNRGRLIQEFEPGDTVLINPHSLGLLKTEKGRGRKLLMKYDGPFEILEKISPITYRLRLPASYPMHPVLNIAHLEKYNPSDQTLGERPTRHLNRADFSEVPEFEVESIIKSKWKKSRNGRRVELLWTKFADYDHSFNEWLTRRQLRNAPRVLRHWDKSQEHVRR